MFSQLPMCAHVGRMPRWRIFILITYGTVLSATDESKLQGGCRRTWGGILDCLLSV